MISKRLQAICSFLSSEDSIIDIGCDHAYVCIEMARRGAKKITATDIHENALEIAKKNLEEEQLENIQTILSDGLRNIPTIGFDTLVIAGMGASTIIHILSEKEKLRPIQKIVLQSNNDLKELREFMSALGYKLENEKVLWESGHYYTIMKYVRAYQKLTEEELEFGIYQKENKKYYQDTKKYYEDILKKIPIDREAKKAEIEKKIRILEKYLNKEDRTIC